MKLNRKKLDKVFEEAEMAFWEAVAESGYHMEDIKLVKKK